MEEEGWWLWNDNNAVCFRNLLFLLWFVPAALVTLAMGLDHVRYGPQPGPPIIIHVID